jgi:hypothetical protein
MTVAIITLPLAYNIGGILQNYALQQVLRKLGHEPITFDQTTGYVARWRLFRHYILQKLKILPKELSPNPSIDNFVSAHICSTPKARFISDFKRYDREYKPQAYIVGSDQVWRGDYVIFPTANFLSFSNCKSKLAYAVSFGTDQWSFKQDITPTLIESAQHFQAISVREESGIKICADALKVDAVHVVDPTMLLTKEDYLQLSLSLPKTENVLTTYILDMDNDKESIIQSILSTLKLHELPLKNSVINRSPSNVSIEQWLAAFRDAKMVVCDSFHGTVFSLIFEKPFIVLANQQRGNARLESLLASFGLQERFVTAQNINLSSIMPIDWNKVRNRKQELINKSLNFLINNLYER